MSYRRVNPYKTYVEVIAHHTLDERIIPLRFRAEDGPSMLIDRVLDMRQAASLKAGGQGMRYTCEVGGKQLYLFHDRQEWFIEAQP